MKLTSKAWLTCLKAAVTAGLTALILLQINFRSVVPVMREGAYWLLIPAAVLWYAAVLCGALRWRGILAHYGIRIRRSESFSLYWIGTFFNNFLPSSMGGDSYKFLLLKRRHAGTSWQRILSSIIIDRGVGFLAMLLLSSALAPAYLPALPFGPTFGAFLAAAGLLLALATLAILASPRMLFSMPEPRNRAVASLIRLINALGSFADARALALALAYSGLFLLLQTAFYQLCFLTFGHPVPFPILLFIVPLLSIAEIFPFALNSIGVREGAGVVLFGCFGVPPAISLSALIMLRLVGTVGGATGGVPFMLQRRAR